MKIDEGLVHVAVRMELKKCGWRLVAGQYPGGSDDECYALNVVDPAVACDNSPDPRRHSENKLVPDLFAIKGRVVVIVEMKPLYDSGDAAKLQLLLTDRKADLFAAMRKFGAERRIPEFLEPENLILVPALGFRADCSFPRRPEFAYFRVSGLRQVDVLAPQVISNVAVGEAFVVVEQL